MIELDDVSAWYGEVVALKGVSATLDEPVVGLLGPNGAGKSTLLSLLCGLRRPNTGRVLVNGEEPYDNSAVLGSLGLVPEPLDPPRWLTGRRMVIDLARMSGMAAGEARTEALAWLERLALTDAMDRPVRTYSQGMRQRVKLAQAMVHKPDVLLLDEPFTGLDPPGRAALTKAIVHIAEAGTQVVFSSHVLAEVEAVTSDVLMLLNGRVAAHGSVREVRAELSSVPLRVGLTTTDPRAVGRTLLAIDAVHAVEVSDGEVVARVTDGARFFQALHAHGGSLPITGFGPLDEDLESVYNLLAHRRGWS